MSRSAGRPPAAPENLRDLILAAACEEERWPETLDRLIRYFHASHGALLIHQARGKKTRVFHTRGNDPYWQRLFENRFKECIPFLSTALHKARHFLKSGSVVKWSQLQPDRELMKTEFYADFMRPQNVHHQLVAFLDVGRGSVSTLTLSRPKKAGAFTAKDVRVLEALMPILQKALQVHHRLMAARMDEVVSQEVLDVLPLGVLILSARGKVLTMNRRAVALLGERDGLSIGPKGLEAVRCEENVHLRKMLTEALGKSAGGGDKGGILLIPRPSGKPSYSLIFIPSAPRPELRTSASAGCVILLSSLEGGGVVSPDILKSLYRLTAAESRFAAQLMQGFSIEESSRRLDVCVATGRTYVKRIFAKTGVRRQGELVHLLVESPARLLLGRLGEP